MNDPIRPIGLDEPVQQVHQVCAEAPIYQHGTKLPLYMITLDAGSGRTTLLEYMADLFKAHKVLPFDSCLDDCVEITLDGTSAQLKRAAQTLAEAAVYTNDYDGVAGIDLSALPQSLYPELFPLLKKLCCHACVVLFFSAQPGKGEERMMEKLKEDFPHIKRFDPAPYTHEQLAQMAQRQLEQRGMTVLAPSQVRTRLEELELADVPEMLACVDALVRRADYSKPTPVVKAATVAMLSLRSGAPRKEVV